MILAVIILVIAVIFLAFLNVKNQKKSDIDTTKEDNQADELMPYNKKYLLTKNEWAFYKKIKPICDENKLHIISKVRLADLVEVSKEVNGKDKQKYFNKIKNKHIDFVLCNPENLAVIALIELDDSSHQREDRVKRDIFVNSLCDKVGYKIIRITQNEDFKSLLLQKEIIQAEAALKG